MEPWTKARLIRALEHVGDEEQFAIAVKKAGKGTDILEIEAVITTRGEGVLIRAKASQLCRNCTEGRHRLCNRKFVSAEPPHEPNGECDCDCPIEDAD